MRTSTKIAPLRGRPPSYDRNVALPAIRDVFWRRGFSAASIDAIAAAAGMNRPSLYGAFGDKREMYLAALRLFAADLGGEVQQALGADTLREALEAFYVREIREYLSGDEGPRGCLFICTAATEAAGDATIRSALATMLTELDSVVAARIERAQGEGELSIASDARALARLVTSVLHSLAVRARAGARRSELVAIARAMVELIVGQAEVPRARLRR